MTKIVLETVVGIVVGTVINESFVVVVGTIIDESFVVVVGTRLIRSTVVVATDVTVVL